MQWLAYESCNNESNWLIRGRNTGQVIPGDAIKCTIFPGSQLTMFKAAAVYFAELLKLESAPTSKKMLIMMKESSYAKVHSSVSVDAL